jgi:hypothetical protein
MAACKRRVNDQAMVMTIARKRPGSRDGVIRTRPGPGSTSEPSRLRRLDLALLED